MTDLMAIVCDVLGDFVARVKRGFPAQLAAAMMDRDFDREIKRPAPLVGEQWAAVSNVEMDWLGWAVPAIMTELDLHPFCGDTEFGSGCGCSDDLPDMTYLQWCDHVAPLIAKRIGCDPKRAAEALSRYVPDRV